ncbi:hypothetical protein RFI_01616 [Reticulomyxa filosa]|uniref:PRA1 family protein n=1 Tax=Reticulomyxa filosa TaxID=46433 RepID=X6PBA8_RETFI|nr:hypothetical protein RFI_01616 [Reticulomyxa filosa]|eukprot:ETO35446.1 hypothetical protein RFI_01616 [Reticulomyxa filosa]
MYSTLETNTDIMLAGLFAMFAVITSPMALVGVALILLFWIYTMKEDSWSVGGKIIISGKYKTLIVMSIIVVAVIWLGILDAIIYGGFIALIVSSIHMVFHKPMSRNNSDMDATDNDIEHDSEELGFATPSYSANDDLNHVLKGV